MNIQIGSMGSCFQALAFMVEYLREGGLSSIGDQSIACDGITNCNGVYTPIFFIESTTTEPGG